MKLNADLIERYKKCWTAEDIEREQEVMLQEMDEVNRARRANGEFVAEASMRRLCSFFTCRLARRSREDHWSL